MSSPAYHLTDTGDRLAYHHTPATAQNAEKPGVIFLGGFRSDMQGSKATFLQQWCEAQGLQFTRFDYQGHGLSHGAFVEGSIGRWKDNALSILQHVTTGSQILVGSSMGGWLMLLVALAVPQRIHALVGIAAAPDFTEDLMYHQFTPEQRTALAHEGVVHLPNCYDGEPYPITRHLIEEGRQHLLLKNRIALHCPVRLLHGTADADVPWGLSLELAERLTSTDVQTHLIKNGDHRMSDPAALQLLARELRALLMTDAS